MLSRRTAMLLGAALPLARLAPAAAQSVPPAGPFTLPPLPYAPSANEPHIDAQTMSLHHDKHHAGYVANLNAAVKDHPKLAAMPVQTLLAKLNEVPDAIRTTIRNNAGGHANHSMFWQVMGGKGGTPGGDLESAINQEFKSFDEFKTRFNRTGAGQFGSGWVFVTVDKAGKLGLLSRPNQDTPLMDGHHVLFGNDVWEHAYYLKYQNRRADYLAAWWNVVNWDVVAKRYAAAKAGTLEV